MKKKKYSSDYRSKSFSSASSILESTLKTFRISKKVQEYAAFPHWAEIVGEDLARVAVPEKIIRGNVLLVRVSDAAWAQELSMQKNAILDKMYQSGLGTPVGDIQFVTGNPKSFAKN